MGSHPWLVLFPVLFIVSWLSTAIGVYIIYYRRTSDHLPILCSAAKRGAARVIYSCGLTFSGCCLIATSLSHTILIVRDNAELFATVWAGFAFSVICAITMATTGLITLRVSFVGHLISVYAMISAGAIYAGIITSTSFEPPIDNPNLGYSRIGLLCLMVISCTITFISANYYETRVKHRKRLHQEAVKVSKQLLSWKELDPEHFGCAVPNIPELPPAPQNCLQISAAFQYTSLLAMNAIIGTMIVDFQKL